MENNLTKEKFEIFMMLCASGIDGNISMNELERICMQFDEKSYNEVFEAWKSMTSPAWLSFFKEHKDENSNITIRGKQLELHPGTKIDKNFIFQNR